MLSPTLDTVRLFLHVLAAAVWVGGQIALAGIVPKVRRAHPEATTLIARGYALVAWPAFAVVVATGLWSLVEIGVSSTMTEWQVTLFVKVLLAIASGAAAAVHSLGSSRLAMALGGALGLVCALGAMFAGILLATGA